MNFWIKTFGIVFLSAIAIHAAEKTPADYVNPLIDTHKSRWFFFSSACRPFGMVNLSPDTKVGDDWMPGALDRRWSPLQTVVMFEE
jgi:putative alpha-1,2-mannosidase